VGVGVGVGVGSGGRVIGGKATGKASFMRTFKRFLLRVLIEGGIKPAPLPCAGTKVDVGLLYTKLFDTGSHAL
jgi:recombinational DNA repair protein (RecF pathway)